MDYAQYKGIVHGLPSSPSERFFISLAFFLPTSDAGLSAASLLKLPKTKLGDAYREGLKRSDPELDRLLKSIDSKKSSVSIYWGEPNEDLEFFLEDLESDLAEINLQSFGYLLIHTSSMLSHDDLSDSDDVKTNTRVSLTPAIEALIAHLEKNYLEVQT